jgi:zinc protease
VIGWTGGRVDGWTVGGLALGLALAVGGPAPAQQIDRSVRPEVPPQAPFKFPAARTHALPNGLRLVVVEDHSVPVVAVRAIVGTDSLSDPPGREGLFAVTLGVLRERSRERSGSDLAAAGAAIGTDVTPTGFTTLAAAFEPALDLMAEMLTQPSLDSSAVERRKVIQSSVARRIAQAAVTAPRHRFYELVYGADDPFVRSLVPTEVSISAITRADVAGFYNAFFSPRRATIVIVGDVSDSVAVAAISRAFGAWRAQGESPVVPQPRPISNETKIVLNDVPSAGTQARLYVGRTGPPRRGPDAVATEAFAAVASARFQETLREKRSFMYSGTIGLTWQHGSGTFVGSAVVDAQKADSALAEWLRILRELSTTRPPTAEEIATVRRSRVGSLPARIDGPDSIAARLVEIARDDLPLDYFERYAGQMSTVTASDLIAAGTTHSTLDHLVIVVSGDRRILEPVLRAANLAPVVVDAGRASTP